MLLYLQNLYKSDVPEITKKIKAGFSFNILRDGYMYIVRRKELINVEEILRHDLH